MKPSSFESHKTNIFKKIQKIKLSRTLNLYDLYVSSKDSVLREKSNWYIHKPHNYALQTHFIKILRYKTKINYYYCDALNSCLIRFVINYHLFLFYSLPFQRRTRRREIRTFKRRCSKRIRGISDFSISQKWVQNPSFRRGE